MECLKKGRGRIRRKCRVGKEGKERGRKYEDRKEGGEEKGKKNR